MEGDEGSESRVGVCAKLHVCMHVLSVSLHCAVLRNIVLCSAILYNTILCYTVLCCAVQCSAEQYSAI